MPTRATTQKLATSSIDPDHGPHTCLLNTQLRSPTVDFQDPKPELRREEWSDAVAPQADHSPDITDWADPETFGREEPIDPVREFSIDLCAMAKARLLRQLTSVRGMKMRARRDEPAAVKFFEANPSWAVGHLFDVVERCGKLAPRKKSRDLLWHAKGGGEFKFLVVNLHKILQQLRISDKYPPVQTLPREQLYRPRGSKLTLKGGGI